MAMTGRWAAAAAMAVLVAAGCARAPAPPQLGPDGQPIPVAYTIDAQEAAAIPARATEQVNALRSGAGLGPLAPNPQLGQAAAAHSADMARQNRAWHWGSDGSSPVQRVQRAGYPGALIGETISESYENDVATIQAWMADPVTRGVIMDPSATQMAMSWYQEPTRKIWWTLLTGR